MTGDSTTPSLYDYQTEADEPATGGARAYWPWQRRRRGDHVTRIA